MKVLLLVAALAVCACAVRLTPLLAEDSDSRVPGEYVVIFNDNVTDDDVTTHIRTVKNLMSYHGEQTNFFRNEYHIGSFRGYGANMDDKLRDVVRSMKNVKYVECSQIYRTMCTLQTSATWGLVRTAFRDWPPTAYDYSYDENSAGEGVAVYIIDTGIFTQHPDFGGRAIWGIDFIDTPSPRTDLNGHGTHVAGTVMSNTYGIAKKATSVAVRVLNENGSGSTAGMVDGINWVAEQHSSGRKSIANMSLGGGRSTTLNNAVNAAVRAGVSFVVAAGNDGQDACNSSPASAEDCVTVGASDDKDSFASFSNYGTCEDIIAPGVAITSTWNSGGVNTISGTSMAAPHVAGVMAKYLSELPADTSPAALKKMITDTATPNMVSGLTGFKSSTPNLLVFKDCQ